MLTLVRQMADKSKTLTVALDLETYAEFAVAAQVFRARSVSSFVHEYVVRQIMEARRLISVEEFARRVEEQKEAIETRSSVKRVERAKSFNLINPSTLSKLGIDQPNGENHAIATEAGIKRRKSVVSSVPKKKLKPDEERNTSRSKSAVSPPRKRRGK